MGATSVFTLPWPELGDLADGPDGYEELALATEAALLGQRDTADDLAWTPTWASNGNVQPSGGSSQGRYQVRNGWCQLWMFTNTANMIGGTGALYVSLPVRPRASCPEQYLDCKLWQGLAGWNFAGWAIVGGGGNQASIYFPIDATNNMLTNWSNSDASYSPGTGTPRIPGQWSLQSGNFGMWGRYLV